MAGTQFTPEYLAHILTLATGVDEHGDLGDCLDTDFAALGYESLGLLETASRIERDYGIRLDDSLVTVSATPRALITAVNAQIGRTAQRAT
ncbi:acyl carrier protein [Streptomyces sp.]|uniref:acyl carrier protein n=1 Tax=Streptomyces sp. TaxID=1931 RepID=UPI002F40AD25